MKTILLFVASLLVAGNWVFAGEEPNLDDPKVREQILKEAVLPESLDERGQDGEKLFYQAGKQTPYTGWVKRTYRNNRKKPVTELHHVKDGKKEGLWTAWRANGQKIAEVHFKAGRKDGLLTMWWVNGEKRREEHYKAGRKDGMWTTWNEDGNVTEETRYKDDEEVKE
jgi:antitoxin component YwqK of YwqJK toxin-antitoxin module